MKNHQIPRCTDESTAALPECCYQCRQFSEFKEPRDVTERDSKYTVYGMCCKGLGKNGSYTLYPVYIPDGRCKEFKKKQQKGVAP